MKGTDDSSIVYSTIQKLSSASGYYGNKQHFSTVGVCHPTTVMNPICPSSSPCEGLSTEEDITDDWLLLSTDSMAPQCFEECRDDEQGREEMGKLKSKLMSAWNSVKYGWRPLKQKSRFKKSSPVTMLGHSYLLSNQVERERFRRSFSSLPWLTYRRGFLPLSGTALTTDGGWGCVLRTGQMLLAQGLLLHLLPSGWTWSLSHHGVRDDIDLKESRPVESGWMAPRRRGRKMSLGSLPDTQVQTQEATHRRVMSWFGDNPTAPFGVHRLVELGKSSGKKAGDWYGPSIVAHMLCKAVAASADLPTPTVYVAQDCTIYKEDVRAVCERHHAGSRGTSQPWRSVIILVPVRLGGKDLNPDYIACVKNLLALEGCIGIIGGKPKHSLFFVGFQDDHLLYLDPHYCQPAMDITQEDFPLESFHCKYPRKMGFTRMDPSCTFGFYAKDQKDFESLCSAIIAALSTSPEQYPMFTFAEGHSPPGWELGKDATPTNITSIVRKEHRRQANTRNSMDEFVLL